MPSRSNNDSINKISNIKNTIANKRGNASYSNINPAHNPTTTSGSTKTKIKYRNPKSKKISQVETIDHTTNVIHHDSIDPTILKPVSNAFNPYHFIILDSSAMVTLVKHKEMLYNLHASHPDSIQITSCSNTNIPFNKEGNLAIQPLNGKHISPHVFYTLLP